MRAVILAGGKGTRLYPYTAIFPKPLVPLGDKPILEILIRQLKYSGVDEITLCVGHLAPLIQTFFQDGKWLGVKINYSFENTPLGTVGPLKLIKSLPDNFIVTNGDLLSDVNFKKIFHFHQRNKADLTIGVYKREEKIDLGVLDISKKKIIGYREKPSYNFYVSTGLYVFSKKILKLVPKDKYFDFPSLVNLLIAENKKVMSYEIKGFWLDIGRPDDYQKAVEKFDKEKELFIKQE
jgi:NDP-mannose synthase